MRVPPIGVGGKGYRELECFVTSRRRAALDERLRNAKCERAARIYHCESLPPSNRLKPLVPASEPKLGFRLHSAAHNSNHKCDDDLNGDPMTVNFSLALGPFLEAQKKWMRVANLAVSALMLLSISSASAQTKTLLQQTAALNAPPVASATTIQPPSQDYLVYVVCESADKVVLVRFGPKGLQKEHETQIGLMPMDINGPHGIAVSPDKKYLYVSVGHGRPDGSVWKLKTGTDEVIRFAPLGLFPATTDISRDGAFIYVANANFHGDMVPSSISVVATDEMIEVKRITTCTMPHGSRLNPQGTKHYSACMMDDMVAEIDTQSLKVSRYFMLTKGKEMGMTGAPDTRMKMSDLSCVPTWAQPSNDGGEVYVACNKSNDIVAIDVASWKLARRFPAGAGVYT